MKLGLLGIAAFAALAITLVAPASRPTWGAQDRPELNSTWVAIEFADQEAGLSSEYMGRISEADFKALRSGRDTPGFIELSEVFWIDDDGAVARLEDDEAFGSRSLFRADRIRRITPVREEFVRGALEAPPAVDRSRPATRST